MQRLENIEAFVEVAGLGSFTRAARRLRISPSALSRRVAQLEAELGVQLLHRTTRKVRLSEEGQLLSERAAGALRDIGAAEAALMGSRGRPVGRVRLESPTILGRHVLVPALTRFLARFAEVEVDLVLRDYAGDLVEDGIDVALRLGDLSDSALIGRRLGITRMRICGAPAYIRRRGAPRSIAALDRHELLGLSIHGQVVPWRICEGGVARTLAPTSRLSVNSGEALLDLVLAGVGLGWMCDFMTTRSIAAGELVEVLPGTACEEIPVQALTLPGRQALPKVRVLLDFIGKALKPPPGAA